MLKTKLIKRSFLESDQSNVCFLNEMFLRGYNLMYVENRIFYILYWFVFDDGEKAKNKIPKIK